MMNAGKLAHLSLLSESNDKTASHSTEAEVVLNHIPDQCVLR